MCNKNSYSSELIFILSTMLSLTSHSFSTPSFIHPFPTREHWHFGLTSSQWACAGPSRQVLTTQTLMGGLAALRKNVPREIPCSAMVLRWKQNGTSSCWVSKPTWAIRLLCPWIPDPPQCLLSRKCCHLLTLLVPDYGSGFFALCRGILRFAKRVSNLFLCLVLWVGQKPVPEVHPWGMKAESSVTFLQRIILSRPSRETLWKHSQTGRRKHTSLCILLSLEGENFISSFPSLNWRREIMEAVEERAKALYKLTMTTWIYWVLTLCPALCLLIIDYVVYCSKVPLKLGTLLTHYIDEERQAHKDNVNSSALHT